MCRLPRLARSFHAPASPTTQPTTRPAVVMVAMVTMFTMFTMVTAMLAARPAAGQGFGGGGFGNQAVGGITINASGLVNDLDPQATAEVARQRQEALAGVDAAANGRRKVSLARLTRGVAEAAERGEPLPVEMLVLGGLTRVELVLVDPEHADIVLVGPAEAPIVGPTGCIVGADSGWPLLQLEDFVVALRSIEGARAAGMTCSIDPTPEGIAKLQRTLRGRRIVGGNPEPTLRAMEEALGPQRVSVTGVPGGSRFARVLVAADYRMKRIGMGFDPSGVDGLPSYLSMIPASGGGLMPRFWLEARYDPIQRDADELAWRISGRRMECLTENELADAAGDRQRQGRADPLARQWCEKMTEHYEKLCEEQPVFAELLNCVDLAVVAALVRGRQLDRRAGLDLSPLLDADAVPLPTYEVPSSVATLASAVRKGRTWVVTASGGVAFQPWAFAANLAKADDLAGQRTAGLATRRDGWWWD